jgi:hypothetical protein
MLRCYCPHIWAYVYLTRPSSGNIGDNYFRFCVIKSSPYNRPPRASALEGGVWSASCPDRFLLPGKTRYPLYRRLGGPQGRSGQVRKISPNRDFFYLFVFCASLFWYWTFNGRLYRIVLHTVDFSSRKNPTASVESKPAILGARGQHANP